MENVLINHELKLSVCIITKNEEKYIEGCIKSVLPVASEIIIMDTGSTDNTKKIIKNFNLPSIIKIYEMSWEDDFSKARNKCISNATGSWILTIDADEILTEESQKKILPFLREQVKNKPIVINFKIINPGHDNSESVTFYRQSLFRNNFNIYFIHPVHEIMTRKEKDIISINCPFLNIYHRGNLRPREELQKKAQLYIKRLNELIKKNKNSNDHYLYYFYLGNAHSNNQDFKEALASYLQSYKLYKKSSLTVNDSFFCAIIMKIAKQFIYYHHQYPEAIKYLEELLKISPDFKDALFYLSQAKSKLKEFIKAIEISEKLISLKNKKEYELNPLGIISYGDSLDYVIFHELSRCYFITGNQEKGIISLKEAYRLAPASKPILLHLIKYYLLEDNLSEALKFFLEVKQIGDQEKSGYDYLANLKSGTRDYKINQLNLLKNIQALKGWTKEEAEQIQNKIENLQ